MSQLTHLGSDGSAQMVDIAHKPATQRRAVAQGQIAMQGQTLALVREGQAKKGDVLGVARIAGIVAAKKTAELIPLCHSLSLSHVAVDFSFNEALPGVDVLAEASTTHSTGVEMEALTAVSITCLTLYDMLKSVDKSLEISAIRLVAKTGGTSDALR